MKFLLLLAQCGLNPILEADQCTDIMNFIAATVVLKSTSPDPVTAYGLSYRSADAVVPGGNGNSEVRLRLLCYDKQAQNSMRLLDGKKATVH